MAVATLLTRAQLGVRAPSVRVETHLSGGLPAFSIVGLPEAAVRESRDRVRSALLNSHFQFPQRRITVNLAPADLPKDGARFDLPIALGILVANGQLPASAIQTTEFVGELALCGALRGISGVLPAALACGNADRELLVPADNAEEAGLARTPVRIARSLLEVCRHLRGEEDLPLAPYWRPPPGRCGAPCLSDVRGQQQARRALEIAAAGKHSLLMTGPPGSGKSMLAQRLPGLLPFLEEHEAIEVAAIHSLARSRDSSAFHIPPYRAPHHTASAVALVGGGSRPRPGEISLAHQGVLFLDELPEFDRKVLEVLREPLESGEVSISRAARQATFPARFQLIAAMNPCPCGWLGDPEKSCGYFCEKAKKYQRRLSGPLMDRIDLHFQVAPVSAGELTAAAKGESSEVVRQRVIAARAQQGKRQQKLNSELQGEALDELIAPHRAWLATVMNRLGLSARAMHRLVRVARTIADLSGEEELEQTHLREALAFRPGNEGS